MRYLRSVIYLPLLGTILMVHMLSSCSVPQSVVFGSSSVSPDPTTVTETATVVPTPVATLTATPTTTATARPVPTTTPVPSPTAPLLRRGSPTPTPSPTLMALSERQQLFDEVWGIIHKHYLYADFRGVDWSGVYAEFAPRVRTVTTNAEFYTLLSEMVGRLGDQHSRFLGPGAAQAEDALSTGHEANVGIGVITLPTTHGALIRQVFPESPADRAGLRSRDRIIAINGIATNIANHIQGPEGSQVRLSVLRPGEQLRDIVLTRRPVEGRVSPTTRRLAGDIGYLSITTLWVNDMDDQVSGALTDLVIEKPLQGLILDLRSNPGGWRDVLTGVLSHFVRGPVGSFFDQQNSTPLVIRESSGPDLRGVPLVVLVDRNTSSYAELMAAILRAEAGALVIGLPLAGNTETIYAYELSGGARLWVAQEGFRLRDGVDLEGQGVQPDILIHQDWTHFSEEQDPYIMEALHHLHAYAQTE